MQVSGDASIKQTAVKLSDDDNASTMLLILAMMVMMTVNPGGEVVSCFRRRYVHKGHLPPDSHTRQCYELRAGRCEMCD